MARFQVVIYLDLFGPIFNMTISLTCSPVANGLYACSGCNRSCTDKRSGGMKQKKTIPISVNDRVSVYIELADAHRLLNEQVLACDFTRLWIRCVECLTLQYFLSFCIMYSCQLYKLLAVMLKYCQRFVLLLFQELKMGICIQLSCSGDYLMTVDQEVGLNFTHFRNWSLPCTRSPGLLNPFSKKKTALVTGAL